ncbi:cation:proton antiporter [Sphingomonas sp. ID0503]|uniref:cation:proton antiporter domain-containing protein n=1 Tax=Sphingomonas sp. ID0503 TaxID=3399691 RepID=UPI003AFAF43E
MALPIQSDAFSDSLVILGAAGLVIPTFARFRINPVIGFILVGILVGPAGLGSLVSQVPWLYYITITDPHSIEPFAEFGIVLLLFSIGLELSFRRLWSMRQRVFGLGASELLLSAGALALSLMVIGQNWSGSIGLGLALALSSTALVLPMAGMTSHVGRAAFSMLLFEDLALVPIIFALGAMAPQAGAGWTELGQTLILGAFTVGVLFIIGRVALPPLFSQAARTKSPELFLAASLLVVILASITTTAVGLSPIVGALLAGLLIAETEYHTEVEVITEPFKGLALGVFLITVGMSVDIRQIIALWDTLILAVAGVIIVKAVITGVLLRLSGFGRGVAAETGLLMSSPSETTLIVLATAVQAQLIQASTAQFWQIVTAIGLTITPLLAKAGQAVAQRVERREAKDDEAVPSSEGPRALIIGFGRVGRLVAQMLIAHERPYLAVDANVDTVLKARKRGYTAMMGDISRPGMLDRLDVGAASAIILTMDDPAQTVRITRQIRALHPDLTIIARARDPNHAAELYKAGVTDAVPETLESSLQLSEAVLVDLGLAMGPVIASIHEKRAELRAKIMEMAEVDREPPIRGRRLRDVAEGA